jgi:hypothetical protein
MSERKIASCCWPTPCLSVPGPASVRPTRHRCWEGEACGRPSRLFVEGIAFAPSYPCRREAGDGSPPGAACPRCALALNRGYLRICDKDGGTPRRPKVASGVNYRGHHANGCGNMHGHRGRRPPSRTSPHSYAELSLTKLDTTILPSRVVRNTRPTPYWFSATFFGAARITELSGPPAEADRDSQQPPQSTFVPCAFPISWARN